MVITRKLAHKVQNDLTAIMGHVEVAKLMFEEGKPLEGYKNIEKAKTYIHTLSQLLYNRIKEDYDLEKELGEKT